MSKPVLVIGNRNYSSWSLRAWLVATKAQIDFETVRIPLFVDGYRQAIAKFSSAGKVPIYIGEDLTVWDSLSISEYIAEKVPTLWPSNPKARALARSISAEMHSGFPALRNAMPMNCRASNRKANITNKVSTEIERIQTSLSGVVAERNESGPWLFGRFTIADAMYAPIISRFVTYGVPMHPSIETYAQVVLCDPDVSNWYTAAREEPEFIEMNEEDCA